MALLIRAVKNLESDRRFKLKQCVFIKPDGSRTEYKSFSELYTQEGMSRYHARLIAKGTPSDIYKGFKIEFL
jgi:hypothetical protein